MIIAIISAIICVAIVIGVKTAIKIKHEYKMFKMQKNERSDAYHTKRVVHTDRERIYYNLPKGATYESRTYIPYKELPSLPIKKFIKFYSVDPSKWRLERGCAYRKDKPSAAIFFQPFLNYKRYEIFRIATEKEYKRMAEEEADRKNAIKQDENLQNILKLVQNDIDETIERTNKQLEKTKELTHTVMTNLEEK